MNKESIMNFASKLMTNADKGYFIRAYLIGLIYAALFYFVGIQHISIGLTLLLLLSWILFPFSKMVWDNLTVLIRGQTVLILPLLLLYIWKLCINYMLFCLAILIAPIGIFILWRHSNHLA